MEIRNFHSLFTSRKKKAGMKEKKKMWMKRKKHSKNGLQTNNISRECSKVYKISTQMKDIATDTPHKIQRYQEATLSVQKHLGPSHAFIHQSIHTNITKLGGGQERHKTLSRFLSNPQYKGSAKN